VHLKEVSIDGRWFIQVLENPEQDYAQSDYSTFYKAC